MAFKDKETGKWVAQWYEPNVYGVNKQKKKRGFKTQREAKQYECDRNLKKQGKFLWSSIFRIRKMSLNQEQSKIRDI